MGAVALVLVPRRTNSAGLLGVKVFDLGHRISRWGHCSPSELSTLTLVGAQCGSEGGLLLLTGGCRAPPVPQVQLAEHRLHSGSLCLAAIELSLHDSGPSLGVAGSPENLTSCLPCRPPDRTRFEVGVVRVIWETLQVLVQAGL